MITLFLGFDAGYRCSDAKSRQHVTSIPSVVSPYVRQNDGQNYGTINIESRTHNVFLQKLVGNTAIKMGSNPEVSIYSNKNFDGEKLSERFLALFFHAVRMHIPQKESKCTLNACIAVPRAEYTLAEDNYGELYSPEEFAFRHELEGAWTIWNDGGPKCHVVIENVIARPQPVMAIRDQILSYNAESDSFGEPDLSWLYKAGYGSEMSEDEKAEFAVSTVVFDIGGFTSHAERICVVNGLLQVVQEQHADIGMWSFLSEIEAIVKEYCGLNHLKPHDLMRIFELERYGEKSLATPFREMLVAQCGKYEVLLRGSFANYHQIDRILLVGRGWHKLDALFKEKWQPIGQKHNFTIHSPKDYGLPVASGAFKSVRAKFGE